MQPLKLADHFMVSRSYTAVSTNRIYHTITLLDSNFMGK